MTPPGADGSCLRGSGRWVWPLDVGSLPLSNGQVPGRQQEREDPELPKQAGWGRSSCTDPSGAVEDGAPTSASAFKTSSLSRAHTMTPSPPCSDIAHRKPDRLQLQLDGFSRPFLLKTDADGSC